METNPSATKPTREELFAQCKSIATSSNVLDSLIEEMSANGFVGEERLTRLTYLSLTTRLFQQPVSVAIKGPSSAGKSHTVGKVLEFFPAAAYYELSAMSPKNLVYSKEPLRHRFLVVCEAAGMNSEIGSYLIRTLLSEGRIRYNTVENLHGKLQGREITIEGPTGLLTTTTLVSMHPENETRILSVPVNDSRQQSRRVLEAIACQSGGSTAEYERWQAYQNWLAEGPIWVEVPFAQKLARTVSVDSIRVRRDFVKLLSLIKAHALLHQCSRETGPDGVIIATLEDYRAVKELVADLFAEAAEVSVSPMIRETVAAVAALQARSNSEGVSVIAAGKDLGLDKGSASRRLKAAAEAGYLHNYETKDGVPAKYCLHEPLPEEQQVLPEVEALAS